MGWKNILIKISSKFLRISSIQIHHKRTMQSLKGLVSASRSAVSRLVRPQITARHESQSIWTKQRERPRGFFLGQKPRKPGEHQAREGWEMITYVGSGGAMVLWLLLWKFVPQDNDVYKWTKTEARARILELDAEYEA